MERKWFSIGLLHSPNGPNDQGWAKSQNFFKVSHVDASSLTFPDTIAESYIESGVARTLTQDAGTGRWQLNLLCHNAGSFQFSSQRLKFL